MSKKAGIISMYLRNNKIIKFLIFCVIFNFTINPVYAEINFPRIFYASKKITHLTGYSLIAHYEANEDSSFLTVNSKDNTYKLLEIGQSETLDGLLLKVMKFDGENLILQDNKNIKYSISFGNEEVFLKIDMQRVYKDSTLNSETMSDDKALKIFKDVAKLIGIPTFISSQFSELPKQARTDGGREGWILDETIPNILLVTSPFKSNDIIVTIDGIPANDIIKLKEHLSEKNNTDFFDVEIQRSGNLKMIRVRL
tara:strand:- start:9054 stop:9815 length:762 start_codon:yes stop_codon:yes gene_type:complete